MSFIPNTTPTPNWLYNGEMKKMNETELKIVLLVTRKTLGWFSPTTNERKTQDYISQSQFKEFTGKESAAIAKGIQSCVDHGWIIAKNQEGVLSDTPEKRARRKTWYQLGNIFTNKLSGSQSKPANLVRKKSPSDSLIVSNLIRKANSTKETITKETKQKKEGKNKFLPPSLEEIQNYCSERRNNIDAEQFHDFYESKGWFIGKNKMKSWQASIRTWERRNKEATSNTDGTIRVGEYTFADTDELLSAEKNGKIKWDNSEKKWIAVG